MGSSPSPASRASAWRSTVFSAARGCSRSLGAPAVDEHGIAGVRRRGLGLVVGQHLAERQGQVHASDTGVGLLMPGWSAFRRRGSRPASPGRRLRRRGTPSRPGWRGWAAASQPPRAGSEAARGPWLAGAAYSGASGPRPPAGCVPGARSGARPSGCAPATRAIFDAFTPLIACFFAAPSPCALVAALRARGRVRLPSPARTVHPQQRAISPSLDFAEGSVFGEGHIHGPHPRPDYLRGGSLRFHRLRRPVGRNFG